MVECWRHVVDGFVANTASLNQYLAQAEVFLMRLKLLLYGADDQHSAG